MPPADVNAPWLPSLPFSPFNLEAWTSRQKTQKAHLHSHLFFHFYFHANPAWLGSESQAGRGLAGCRWQQHRSCCCRASARQALLQSVCCLPLSSHPAGFLSSDLVQHKEQIWLEELNQSKRVSFSESGPSWYWGDLHFGGAVLHPAVLLNFYQPDHPVPHLCRIPGSHYAVQAEAAWMVLLWRPLLIVSVHCG